MSAAHTLGAPARQPVPRRLLIPVDRRDTALMSMGTLASGLLAYGFNVLAARSLGPEAFGAVGALWAVLFLLAVLLFRPLEQTLSRAIADHLARGADARPAVRSTARLGALTATGAALAVAVAWDPLTSGLFGGRPGLTAALAAGLVGYAASYFVRGLAGGLRWFSGYGTLLLADGGVRMLVALPLVFFASPTVAAAAIAVAAFGGAVAPLLTRGRHRLRGLAGDGGAGGFALGRAVRFAMPAVVIAACEMFIVNGGPLLVLVAGGEGAAAAAGVLFAATLLVRAPVFLFQGVAAHLLPNLTTFQARGDASRIRRSTLLISGGLIGVSAVCALAALAVGPWMMALVFGDAFGAGRVELALFALGVGGFLAASTFCQALLARDRAGRAAVCWSVATVVFVALQLGLDGDGVHRVSVAFAAASTLVAVLLTAAVWRQEP